MPKNEIKKFAVRISLGSVNMWDGSMHNKDMSLSSRFVYFSTAKKAYEFDKKLRKLAAKIDGLDI